MDQSNEPVINNDGQSHRRETGDNLPLRVRIHDLLQSQPFAVLCTQGAGQPYGSVVAYVMSRDLRTAVFATKRTTTKYRLLSECDRVALVVDSRSAHPDDFMQVEAVTATGQARELALDSYDSWAGILTDRHPQLKTFVESPTTALFKISLTHYLYVSRFQEVRRLDLSMTAAIEEIS